MENIHILMAGLTAIILFIFGLENFSREIESITGEKFRKSLAHATRIPIVGLIIGAGVTAVIKSSSATSVIAISLVNAGVISFKNSVGIIMGSNIGTTVTSQLVAFKLTAFAPLIIILGFVLSLLKSRYSVFGKAIFYFGFVFFSLNLISSSLQPLQSNETLIQLLSQPQNPLYALFFGFLFTAVVQSSSVTTGLAIIFTQQGILGLDNAVPLIMGANIGTTTTAMVAMFNMDASAKKTALSHFFFNVGGVCLFFPIYLLFTDQLREIDVDPAIALATIHLIFNVCTSLLFVVFIGQFTRFVDRLVGEGTMDFERLVLPVFKQEDTFEDIKGSLREQSNQLFNFLQENYNVVTLSIETNYQNVFETARKRIEYIDFVEKEYINYFANVSTVVKDSDASKEFIHVVTQFDYLFQIHDSISDLYATKKMMTENWVELKSDILILIRKLSSETLAMFESLRQVIAGESDIDIKNVSRDMQLHLNEAQRHLLELLADAQRQDAGALTNFVTYSQRLKDKLIIYAQGHTKAPTLVDAH